MNTKRIMRQSYLVISGVFFGGAFGIGIFLLVNAIVGNLLALTVEGRLIMKALHPVTDFLTLVFLMVCIICGIVLNLRRENKTET